jgi:hypothetical protein
MSAERQAPSAEKVRRAPDVRAESREPRAETSAERRAPSHGEAPQRIFDFGFGIVKSEIGNPRSEIPAAEEGGD